MKLIFRYFLICGLLAHLTIIVVLLHFRFTGLTPHLYIRKGIGVLDRDSSPTRHIARAARALLLDSGLFTDPIVEYPPDLTVELPQWRGVGANALRTDTAPRYTSLGEPVATTDEGLWALGTPPAMRRVPVDSLADLKKALANARPGDAITLMPGHYRLSERLQLKAEGTPDSPLLLRGESIADTVLELEDGGSLAVNGKYWNLSDLIVRGQCPRGPCPFLVDIGNHADRFTARNLFVSGLRTLLNVAKMPGASGASASGLIDGVTLVDARISTSALDWPQSAIREIAIPREADKFSVVCVQKDASPGCDTDNLAQAIKRLSNGGLLLMRTGRYQQAATLRTEDLHILAEPGATLHSKSTAGKGALVVNAGVTIEGLACSHIKVNDGNGACVRQQHGDVTLIGVHFHHAQMGILTGHNGGNIRILDSYFHDSGYDESGQLGHNIYVNSGTLEFIRSWSLAARNAGHELKSRAAQTIIANSLLASLNSRDSRLIDAPNAGILEVRGSVLGEGPRSENQDLIGYGLELKEGRQTHETNTVTIRGNTIYIDRPQGAQLLNEKTATSIDITDNIVIGDISGPPGNTYFDGREEAGSAAYPTLHPKTL